MIGVFLVNTYKIYIFVIAINTSKTCLHVYLFLHVKHNSNNNIKKQYVM